MQCRSATCVEDIVPVAPPPPVRFAWMTLKMNMSLGSTLAASDDFGSLFGGPRDLLWLNRLRWCSCLVATAFIANALPSGS